MAHSTPPPPDGMSSEEIRKVLAVAAGDLGVGLLPSLEGMGAREIWAALTADVDDRKFEEYQRELFATQKFCYPRCMCDICSTHFYKPEQQQQNCQYTSYLSAPAASQLLSGYTNTIFTSQDYLRQAMQEHGEQILHYWRATDQRTRAKLLRTASPEMPQSKNFDAGKSCGEIRRSTNRMCLLLPYLEVDTLAKNPEALIGLIRYRVAAHPQEWALFDNEQLRRSWALGLVESQFNHGAVSMHGPRYGHYTTWHADAAHRLDTFGFPRGRLIIEAQAMLMMFLRHVVEKLSLASHGVKVPSPALSATLPNVDSTWSEIAHQPFAKPPVLELDGLIALAKSRTDAINDHLWLLQTEPSYLRNHVLSLNQMKSAQSATDPEMRSRVVFWELCNEFYAHLFWQGVSLELEHLRTTYRRFSDSITSGAQLPRRVDEAFAALEALLVAMIQSSSSEFRTTDLPQRPQFQHLYKHGKVFRTGEHGCYIPSTDFLFAMKTSTDSGPEQARLYRKEKLWWILNQLVQAPDDETGFSHIILLGALNDHLANTSANKRDALDQILYEKLSDYIAFVQLLSALRMHRPRFSSRSALDLRKTQDRYIWRTMSILTEKESLPSERVFLKPQKAIEALQEFRSTAAPSGPRNEAWLDIFNKQHAAMQNFWKEFSIDIRRVFQQSNYSSDDMQLAMEPHLFWEAPEYLARLDAKRESVLSDIAQSKVTNVGHAFLPLPSTANPVNDRAYIKSETKVKVKTKGTPCADSEDPTVVEEVLEELNITTITLSNKRFLTTFRAMFPSSPLEVKAKVHWNTLVDSMNDAGFVAKNCGGSVVKFEDRNGRGSINFHRPHPEPVVQPNELHAMGWRMSKHFGWAREMFVLGGK